MLTQKLQIQVLTRKQYKVMEKDPLSNLLLFQNYHLKKFLNVMRITTFFLFLCVFASFAANTSSQNAKVNISGSNMTVGNFIDQIEKQTDYLFVYSKSEVNVNESIAVKNGNKSVAQYLSEAFAATDVKYAFENDYIILTKNASPSVSQQDKNITGIVTDSRGETIIGANVIVKGSSNGTITDLEGKFAISAPNGAILQVSYIGYLTKEMPVGNKSVINIVLTEDSQALDEVVVVGYGTQKKVNLTGAIVSVKTEDLENIPSSNLSNSLAGRAPGVTVTNTSGMAGASSKIRMRGSFGEPLFVINNIIKSKADFDALDPNEVQSINFLKDAASASVYGSKAGNGVVLVTTKAGKLQKPEFQYKGIVSTAETTRPLQDYSATDELIWANRVSETKGLNPVYGQEAFDYFKDKSYNVNDYVWQNPSSRQHNISVNGGNEAITYYMMLGYHDEDGSYKNLEYKKYNFRSDITANISKRFKVNLNLSGNQRQYDRFYWPYDKVDNFNVPDFYRTTFNWSRLYPFYVDDKGNPTNDVNANPVTAGSWHPVDMVLGNRYQKITQRTLDGILKFDLDLGQFVDGLSTSVLAQYTAYDNNQKAFITHNKSYRFQSASATNKFVPGPVDPNNMVLHNLSSNYEGIREYVTLDNSYQLNWFLKYDKIFGKHAVSGLAVYEQSETNGKNLSGSAEELMTSSIDQIFATSSDTQRRYFSGNEYQSARQSWVGRFNYSYADKYIAEFSFRYDGNYKFAPSERWGFFPSASLAWRISEESFLKKVSWLSNLKLRGSFGSTGDDNNWDGEAIAAFQWREFYKNGSGYIFGNNLSNGLAIGNTPNPYISWAKLEVYNIGLDYGMLDNRLSGELDYFYKNKNHILKARNMVIPGTYGAGLSNENYAEQEWNGVEFNIKWSDSFKDLKYTVYGNLGYVKDNWVKLDEPVGLEAWRSAIGKPNNRIQGYIAEGLIRTQEQLDALPAGFTQFGRKPILGTILFKDIRGANYQEGADGKIDGNDFTNLSDLGTPRINYGFGLNLEWKGIALDAHFQGVGAYDRMLSTKNGSGVFQVGEKPYFELWTGNNVWTPENPGAKYPRVSGFWQEEYGAAGSTYWLRNGAYMRLKNLNLAYSLPSKWFSKIGVSKVQVFANGTNLFAISGIDEHDPEQEALDSYPLMRTYTAGLSVNF